jgi:hypothetical protein
MPSRLRRIGHQKPFPRPDLSSAAAALLTPELLGWISAEIAAPLRPLQTEPTQEEFLQLLKSHKPGMPRILRAANPGCYGACTDRERSTVDIESLRQTLRSKGISILPIDPRHDVDKHDVAILPTLDPYAILGVFQTDGANYGIHTGDLVEWLRKLERTDPFELLEISLDMLRARFQRPPRDPDALARRIYAFCPDIVDQGVRTVEALAADLQTNQELYLWWD